MTSAANNIEKIIPAKDYLSLWDIAHRLANLEQSTSDPEAPPSAVIDVLQAMLFSQLRSELAVVTNHGIELKDDRYLPSVVYFNSDDTETWCNGYQNAVDLYLDFINQKTDPLHQYISHHNKILKASAPYSKTYLNKIYTTSSDLAEWAIREELPFPYFWFHDDEVENIQLTLKIKILVDEKCQQFESSKACPLRDLIEKDILAEHTVDEATEPLPNTYKRDAIDTFWGTLTHKQRSRILCREIASTLWKYNPTMSIEDIRRNEVFLKYGGAAHFSSKNTTRDWIKDLDTRPASERAGRPRL